MGDRFADNGELLPAGKCNDTYGERPKSRRPCTSACRIQRRCLKPAAGPVRTAVELSGAAKVAEEKAECARDEWWVESCIKSAKVEAAKMFRHLDRPSPNHRWFHRCHLLRFPFLQNRK